MSFDRTALMTAIAVTLSASPALAEPTAKTTLPVTAQRSTSLTSWVPRKVRGVVIFSTGHGSWPEKYDAVASAWKAAGFAVVAPLHVDSIQHPQREKFTQQASFGERLADMKAASAYAAREWPDKPIVAAGHSFGTLTALCLGGGLTHLGNFRDPRVKAVVGFSSPGRIPGLVVDGAYANNRLPVMLITGDQDTVPGLVSDWRDHLLPIQSSPPGDKYAIIYRGGSHEMVGQAGDVKLASAITASTRFLQAYALLDSKSKRALRAIADTSEITWTKR